MSKRIRQYFGLFAAVRTICNNKCNAEDELCQNCV